jgi:hypothetical protein
VSSIIAPAAAICTASHSFVAAAKGRHGGRRKVIDDDMLLFAGALQAAGTPVPQIARAASCR